MPQQKSDLHCTQSLSNSYEKGIQIVLPDHSAEIVPRIAANFNRFNNNSFNKIANLITGIDLAFFNVLKIGSDSPMKGQKFTTRYDLQRTTSEWIGKIARCLLLFSLSIELLPDYRYSSNGRDSSVYTVNLNKVVLISFHWSPHMPILMALCPPFPFAYSRANEAKITTVFNLRASNSIRLPCGSFVSLLLSFRLPSDGWSKRISKLFIGTMKQISQEHAEQDHTISNAIPRRLIIRRGILQHIRETF